MNRVFFVARIKPYIGGLCLVLLFSLLCSCSFFGLGATPPPVWTNYTGQAFTMNYMTNWTPATKDLYLGTSYPQLEMLQGTIFSEQGNATTFVQVVYANATGTKASVNDLLSEYILGTVKQPFATTNLSAVTLAGQTWTQGVVQKTVSSTGGPGGSTDQVKETALGVSYAPSANQTIIYLILYQDVTGNFGQTNKDYFTRMVNSFHFGKVS
jgi:hypothetical protein